MLTICNNTQRKVIIFAPKITKKLIFFVVGLTVFRGGVEGLGALGAIRVIGRLENLGKDKLTKFLKFHILTTPQARPKAHRGRVVFYNTTLPNFKIGDD